jgi:predicted aspartyl protease
MGVFRIEIEIENLRRPTRQTAVPDLLVATGSELTWIPQTVLDSIGIKVVKKDLPLQMANGQTITRSTGYALLRAAGFETVDEVVFGQPGDLPLLGARTLEGFGATVDPQKRRLVVAGPYTAAVSSGGRQ